MKTSYRWLVLIAVMIMGGVKASAQDSWDWGYNPGTNSENVNSLNPHRNIEIICTSGNNDDYKKNTSEGGVGGDLSGYKIIYNDDEYNGAINLRTYNSVKEGNTTISADTVKIKIKVKNSASRYSNITIGVALPNGTYDSGKSISFDGVRKYLLTDGETYSDNKGFKEVTIWDVTDGEHTIGRWNCNVGIFYIKVTGQDATYTITSLPGAGYSPAMWRSFNWTDDNKTDVLMRAYLGGWKYQKGSRLEDCYPKTTDTYYKDADNSAQKDSWDDAKTNYSPGAEDPYYYDTGRKIPVRSADNTEGNSHFVDYSYAQDNAKNEFIENGYAGAYEFEKANPASAADAKGNPFTVPAFGDFIKLEPEVDGTVHLYVMQNGAIEYDVRDVRKETNSDFFYEWGNGNKVRRYHGGLTSKICWRPVYIVDEAGTRLGEDKVKASTNTDISIGREDEKAYVYDFDDHLAVLVTGPDATGDYVTDSDGKLIFDDTTTEDKEKGKDVSLRAEPAKYKRKTYKACFEALNNPDNKVDQAHYEFYTSKYNIGGTEYEVWPKEVDTSAEYNKPFTERVWGPQYTGDGWIVVSKGYVLYDIEVKAGKSYYVFSNDTKLGFCGYEFEKAESTATNTLELSDGGKYKLNNGAEQTITNSNIPSGSYASVTLNRKFNPGWNAICLPFSVTESKMREWFGTPNNGVDQETYELVTYNGAAYDGQGRLIAHFFHHIYQDIIAGYPYMLYIANEKAKAIMAGGVTFENVTIEENPVIWSEFTTSNDYMPSTLKRLYEIATVGDYTYKGFYEPTAITKGSYYVTAGGYNVSTPEGEEKTFEGGLQLYNGDGATLKGFRAVLEPTATGAGAKEMVRIAGTNFTNILDEVGADWNDATVINEIAEEMGFFNEKQNVYSITGQLVRQNSTSLVGLPKGIYIVNGKKYFVK